MDMDIGMVMMEWIETMLYDPALEASKSVGSLRINGIYLLDHHINRMYGSIMTLGKLGKLDKNMFMDMFMENLDKELKTLKDYSFRYRIRVLFHEKTVSMSITSTRLPLPSPLNFEDGNMGISTRDLFPIIPYHSPLQTIVLDTQPIESGNIYLYHKTTNRTVYDDARKRHGIGNSSNNSNNSIFDVLLFNESSQITECTIANFAIRGDLLESNNATYTPTQYVTPFVSCGLLPGVMRSHLLDISSSNLNSNYQFVEGVVLVQDITSAINKGKISNQRQTGNVSDPPNFLCFNSVRGIYPVNIVIVP